MTEPWIVRLLEAQLGELEPTNPSLAESIRDAGGVLLYGTIGSAGYLRPDGSVWINDADNWDESVDIRFVWREATGPERWSALVLGSRRMPEIAQLLPKRSADAIDCAACGRTGNVRVGEGADLICSTCGGMGWLSGSAT